MFPREGPEELTEVKQHEAEILPIGIMRGTVIHFDLSHMDSLGDPVATK